MRISKRVGVLFSGCGCLLLINTGLLLLILYLVATSQPLSDRLSLSSLFAPPALTSAAERFAPRHIVATVVALATEVHTIFLNSEATAPAQTVASRPSSSTATTFSTEPTATSRPTSRPRATSTPEPTATSRPTSTPRPTATRVVSRAPAVNPNQATTRYYVVAAARVNVRSCPRTSCNVVTSLARGAEVNVLQRVSGDSVSGNTSWQAVKHNNAVVYIHAPLLSRTRPQPQQAQPAQPAAAQPQQAQPAQVSAPPTTVPGPQFSCNCSKTCTQMASCAEAYFQLNPCRCGRRDGDNDGVPCESICPGG